MKADKASATARLIAAATVLCANDAKTADLVPPGASAWCQAFLATSRADRWLRATAEFGMSRAAWRLLERATHPGIVRHWMARKQWIEQRVRHSLTEGVSQVVVLGAGLDTLGVRLAAERPDVRVVEIDHPATLAVKRAAIENRPLHPGGPILVGADFGREDGEPLACEAVIRDRPTLFLAEGLLMYLSEARVRSLLGGLATRTKQPRLIFSFMVEREGGAIGFEPRSALVSWWLARKDERFLWSLDPTKAGAFARGLGWEISEHADANTLAGLANAGRAIARGEEVIELTSTRA